MSGEIEAAQRMALMLAQTPADPISGGAGWVGAGLLGAVLAWLMFVHLPSKDKQIRDLLALFSEERERDREMIGLLTRVFKEDIGAERVSCDQRTNAIIQAINGLATELRK